MKFSRQTTLRSQATVTGVGVHSGLSVSLTLGPAPVDAGFIFVRTGLDGCEREVQATAEAVIATEFATVLGDRAGPLVSTAEHVLAALRGMGVDNATIEVDGPEVPIMDGSAADFVAAIDQAGIVTQPASRRFIQVLKPVQVAMGDSFGELRPYAAGFRAESSQRFPKSRQTIVTAPKRANSRFFTDCYPISAAFAPKLNQIAARLRPVWQRYLTTEYIINHLISVA